MHVRCLAILSCGPSWGNLATSKGLPRPDTYCAYEGSVRETNPFRAVVMFKHVLLGKCNA